MGRRAIIGILTGAVALAGPARAQAQKIGIAINPYIGAYHFDESSFEDAFERSDVDSDLIYGLRVGLGGHEGLSLDLAYGQASIEGEVVADDIVRPEDATARLLYAAANWHLPVPVVDVFASGGLGAITYDPDERDGATDLLVNYGAGLTVPIGQARLRADLKDHVDVCDAPEEPEEFDFGACVEDEALHNIELSAGVEFTL